MKKVVVIMVLLLVAVMLVGCLDYKAYDTQTDDSEVAGDDDESLLKEIEKIEQELEADVAGDTATEKTEVPESTEKIDSEETNTDEKTTETEDKVDDVVLPELTKDEATSTEDTANAVHVVNVKENEMVKLNVAVQDPDKDPVTITYGKPLNSAGQWKTNYGDAGDYMTEISATDGKLTTTKNVKIVVERVNVAPVISPVQDINVKEGEVVNFVPQVTDPNNDPVTVKVTEPLMSGSFATDHTSAGQYKIVVSAGDGELDTEKTFILKVEDVNVKPEVSNLQDISVKEGEKVEINPLVTDLDGDNIKLTISDPVGDDGIWETSFTDHGTYQISVTADDGKDKIVKQITLTIEDVNKAPEFVDVSLMLS